MAKEVTLLERPRVGVVRNVGWLVNAFASRERWGQEDLRGKGGDLK